MTDFYKANNQQRASSKVRWDEMSRYLTEVNKIWNTPETRIYKYLSSAGGANLLHNGKTSAYSKHKHLHEPEAKMNTSMLTESKFPRKGLLLHKD